MDSTVTPESPPPQEASPDAAPDMRTVRRQLRTLAKKTAREVGPAAEALGLVTLQIESALLAAYTLGRSESQDGRS